MSLFIAARSRRPNAARKCVTIEVFEPRVLLSTYTVTNLNDSGAGSLRDAIQQANVHVGDDTVTFAVGLIGALTPTTPIEISDTTGTTSLVGNGTGATSVSIAGVGLTIDPGARAAFSAVAVGEIVNHGNLSLSNCNTNVIYNEGGTLAATDCFMQAIGPAQGSGIYNGGGSVTLDRVQISQTSRGTAIYSNGGSMSLRDCSLFGSDGLIGGGIIVSGGVATLTQTTIWTHGQDLTTNSANVTLVNSTLGSITVLAATSGDLSLYNTIVVGSITGTLDQHLATGQSPSSYNLLGSAQAGGLSDGVNGNQVGVNPMVVSPPGDAGGGIETMMPLRGSPAIDAGSNALAVDAGGVPLAKDARGFARVFNGRVDIGAAETQPFAVNSTAVQSTARGEMTLVEAMGLSVLYSTPVRFDPVVFAPGTTHVVRLVTDVNRSVTIQGPGRDIVTLQVNPTGPGINANATFSLSGVTITGSTGSAFFNDGTLEIDDCAFIGNKAGLGGGAIWNHAGTLHVTRTIFMDNSAATAGGVYNQKGQTALIEDCTFFNNSATGGGGGAIANAGNLAIINCTFQGNSATSQGGAIINLRQDNISGFNLTPHLTLTNCTVVGNAAPLGGGLAAASGAATLDNCIVALNTDHATANDVLGIVGGSNNLIGPGGSGGLANGVNGNIVGVADPKLGPLGNYGGPTETVPLLPGSPALDAGSNALSVDGSGNPLTTDQRGLPRIFNGTVDIGAYEAEPPALSADVNHDGVVNFSDLLLLAQHYGSTTQPLWEGGDLTGDGAVAFPDLLVLAQNYGHSASAAAASSLDALRHSAGSTTLVRRRAPVVV